MPDVQRKRRLEVVTWPDVRAAVSTINHELAQIIDEISPNNDFKLIKASYLYGDLIIDNGILNLPDDYGILHRVDDNNVSEIIRHDLTYQNIPLFLTLKNDNEVFANTGSRVVPLNLFHQGSLLGLFETINFIYGKIASSKWCVSAGARSIVMLPRISDNNGLGRLRLQYNIPLTIDLKTTRDYWDLFAAIAKSPHFTQPWQNEILFFTKNWLTALNDPKWARLKEYIYQQGWKQAQFSIGKIESSLRWEVLAETIATRNLKPRPYLADHVKHLFSIATGGAPAFRPTCGNQAIAPIQGLQDALLNVYQLRDYIPTIMCIAPLKNHIDSKPLYYSLSFPTLLEGSPIDKSTSTIILDLRNIKLLIDTLTHYGNGNSLLKSSMTPRICFSYFHPEHDKRGEIRSSSEIFLDDESFNLGQQLFPDRKLCDTSLFWRGCIRIIVSA